MARARNIKPGFFDNETLGELPALTRLLFIGLWCLADREGRLQDRPKRIKKELLGYDDITVNDVDTMLQQLYNSGFIQRYEIDGERYIQVVNFLKHQNPHCKEQASIIPAPGEDMGLDVAADRVKGRTETAGDSQDPRTYQTETDIENLNHTRKVQCKHSVSTMQEPEKHSVSTVQASERHRTCPADSLIPDSLIPDSKKHMVVAEPPTALTKPPTGIPEQERADGVGETGTAKRQQQSPDWKTARTPLEVGFCKFWDAYPDVRKRAKPACWRKWQTIKPNEPMVSRMLHTIEVSKGSRDWKQGFVPAPLTWLNQGRWEDVREEVRTDGESKPSASHTAGFRTSADY